MTKTNLIITNNENCICYQQSKQTREIRQLMPEEIEILSLKDINCLEELPETSDTLEDNAAQKAFYVFDNYGHNCFADDTGLEIDALDGRPWLILLVMQDRNARQKITSRRFWER